MKILVIEDEKKVADSLKRGLEQEAFAVDVAYDGLEGYDLASMERYDMIILDLMLPGKDGISICQTLRREDNTVPILMLTARGEIEDRVEGLNIGADDYMVKPFSFDELVARTHALLRRPKELKGDILAHKDLRLDTLKRQVYRGEILLDLSNKEYQLLEYLMQNVGVYVSKEQILENVWPFEADILPNTIEVYVGYLRSKIEKAFPEKEKLIHTKRGFGYKIA